MVKKSSRRTSANEQQIDGGGGNVYPILGGRWSGPSAVKTSAKPVGPRPTKGELETVAAIRNVLATTKLNQPIHQFGGVKMTSGMKMDLQRRMLEIEQRIR